VVEVIIGETDCTDVGTEDNAIGESVNDVGTSELSCEGEVDS